MPGALTNYSVTAATPVAIVATVTGNTIQVYQAALGTTPFSVLKAIDPPTGGASIPSSVSRSIAASGIYTLTKGFSLESVYTPGEIVCFVQSSSGTITIQCDEFGS